MDLNTQSSLLDFQNTFGSTINATKDIKQSPTYTSTIFCFLEFKYHFRYMYSPITTTVFCGPEHHLNHSWKKMMFSGTSQNFWCFLRSLYMKYNLEINSEFSSPRILTMCNSTQRCIFKMTLSANRTMSLIRYIPSFNDEIKKKIQSRLSQIVLLTLLHPTGDFI